MRDEAGVVQLWLISPQGDELRQLTHTDPISAFNWHPSGKMAGLCAGKPHRALRCAGGRSTF
jgi:hypothetical protein